jgi:hypothetical protein
MLGVGDESVLSSLKRGRIAQRNFEMGENALFEERLLEYACDQGIADTTRYCLSATAKEIFLSDVNLRDHKKARRGDITEKELHYSDKLCRQAGELTALLRE